MSRLDSFIRRMRAQHCLISYAIELIAEVEGPILDLGLGSGRTYNHFSIHLPDRAVFAFDNNIYCRPEFIPPSDRLILGEIDETLNSVHLRTGAKAALIHNDLGSGEQHYNEQTAKWLSPHVNNEIGEGGIVITSFPLQLPKCEKLKNPEGVPPDRYHLYRSLG